MGLSEGTGAPVPAAAAAPAGNRGACAAALAAVAAIILYRRPDEFFAPQFSVEDGALFFRQALEDGPASILRPYVDYLHLFPRLVAWGASFLPVLWAPALYAWTSLAVILGVCAYLFRPRAGLPRPALLAVCLAFAPNAVFLFGNITHSQWFLAFLLPVLAVQEEPRDRRGAAADLALLALVGLTGPFAILALPLFAFRWARDRAAHSLRMLAVCAACAAVQGALLLSHRWTELYIGWSARYWTHMLSMRLGGELLLGETIATTAPTWLLVALTAGMFAGLAYLVRGVPAGRRFAAALAGFSLALLVAFYSKSVSHLEQPHRWGQCGRYFLVPLVSTLWIAVAGLETPGIRRRAAAAFLVLALGLSTTSVGFRWVRRDHVGWEFTWSAVAARIEAGERVHVPVPFPWDFHVRRGGSADATAPKGR
jgi:hypothetical protein